MNVVEKTGKTVEDAVKAALAELGVSRDEVEVEVLESSKSSILGLFGGRDAKVRVTVKEAPAPEPEEEPVAEAAPEAEEAPEAPAAPEKRNRQTTGKPIWWPRALRPRNSWKRSSQPWAWT